MVLLEDLSIVLARLLVVEETLDKRELPVNRVLLVVKVNNGEKSHLSVGATVVKGSSNLLLGGPVVGE